MKAILFVVLIQLGNVSVANSAATKAELEVSLSGTLHGGIMAIGGETTGWELAYSKNGQRSTVEVDMEAIEKAMAFDGKKEGLPEMRLFNLEADPGETKNLLKDEPKKVKELLALLDKQVEQGRCTPGEAVKNDRELKVK